jgi:hypothetical protein
VPHILLKGGNMSIVVATNEDVLSLDEPVTETISREEKLKRYNKNVVEFLKKHFRKVIVGDSVRFSAYENTAFFNCNLQFPPAENKRQFKIDCNFKGYGYLSTRYIFNNPFILEGNPIGGFDEKSKNIVLNFNLEGISAGELDNAITHNLEELEHLIENIEDFKIFSKSNYFYVNLRGKLYRLDNTTAEAVSPEENALNLSKSVHNQKVDKLNLKIAELERLKSNYESNYQQKFRDKFSNFIPFNYIERSKAIKRTSYGAIAVFFKHDLVIKSIINSRYCFTLDESIKHTGLYLSIEYWPKSVNNNLLVACSRCYLCGNDYTRLHKYFHSCDSYKLCFGDRENAVIYDKCYNNADELIGHILNKMVNFETINVNSVLTHIEDEKFRNAFNKMITVKNMADAELTKEQIKIAEEEIGCKITNIGGEIVWTQPQQ